LGKVASECVEIGARHDPRGRRTDDTDSYIHAISGFEDFRI
jgi:hypothetical protein